MTATPIPRTLALTLYGDLDSASSTSSPRAHPHRHPPHDGKRHDEVWDFVRKQVALRRQAYIVYPVIEGANDDQPELDFSQDAPLDQTAAGRRAYAKPDNPQEPPKKRKAPLFPAKKHLPLQPNSTFAPQPKCTTSCAAEPFMIFVSACSTAASTPTRKTSSCAASSAAKSMSSSPPQSSKSASTSPTPPSWWSTMPSALDLPRLHQLRGRVGRGAAKSYCVLMTGDRVSEQAEERLDAMVRTQNGFELAELDLAMRGPGEFFGTRQAGTPSFRVANLVRDRDLLELAKVEASRFAASPEDCIDPEERKRVWSHLRHAWQRRYGLMEAG